MTVRSYGIGAGEEVEECVVSGLLEIVARSNAAAAADDDDDDDECNGICIWEAEQANLAETGRSYSQPADGLGAAVSSRLQHASQAGVTLALRQTGGHVLADQTKRVCGWRVPCCDPAHAMAQSRFPRPSSSIHPSSTSTSTSTRQGRARPGAGSDDESLVRSGEADQCPRPALHAGRTLQSERHWLCASTAPCRPPSSANPGWAVTGPVTVISQNTVCSISI